MTVNNQVKLPARYDIVGSYLRPESLKQARAALQENKITRAELTQIENEEIKHLVDTQVALGLKAVTDGEFRRSWWHLDFFDGLNGAHFFEPAHGFIFNGQETRKGGIRLTDKLSYNPKHPFFTGFEYLSKLVPDGVLAKQTIPSPSVLFPNEDAEIFDEHYAHDFESFLQDEIITYQKTIQHFYDLGCRYLQIDDTS